MKMFLRKAAVFFENLVTPVVGNKSLYTFLDENDGEYIFRNEKEDYILIFEDCEDSEELVCSMVKPHPFREGVEVITRVFANSVDELVDRAQEVLDLRIGVCDRCGKPYVSGYTDNAGMMHCCDDCFRKVMNRLWPNGWKKVKNDFEDGGQYICVDSQMKLFNPGIYHFG